MLRIEEDDHMDIESKITKLRKQVNDEVTTISRKMSLARFYSRVSNLSVLILSLVITLSASLFYENVQQIIIVLGGIIIFVNGIEGYFRFAKQSKELQWIFNELDTLRMDMDFYFEGKTNEEVNEEELLKFHERFVDVKGKITNKAS